MLACESLLLGGTITAVIGAVLTFGLACTLLSAQPQAAAPTSLEKAYNSLKTRDYDAAITWFRNALEQSPNNPAIHKDLAYTLLKVGENEDARDQFAEAMKLDPADQHVALEYAFLCYETRRQVLARRIFDRIRRTGDPVSRATAERAFQNIDRPLAEGIARWKRAVELEPDNFSAHQELARLAEQRDEWTLAALHYEKAWRLRPDRRELLLDLGRVLKELGQAEQANAALLAASRGGEPRVAEEARALLPTRYPYVYEFQRALVLDQNNVELRRELAYLFLQMDRKAEAEEQFRSIVKLAPEDLLSVAQLGFLLLGRKDISGAMPLLEKVLKSDDEVLADRVRYVLKLPRTFRRRPETPRSKVSVEAKTLAERSFQAGYLKDAMKYLTIAHENDPVDFGVMLQLGWTYNLLKEDKDAVRWFDLARRSPDPAVSSEAERAYRNLSPQFARFRTSAWVLPVYSSRWKDVFSYGQIKTEIRLGRLPFRPYLSTRFVGDTRRTLGTAVPQYLSESALVLGLGIASNRWHGLSAWAEAGSAVSYLDKQDNTSKMSPDYRGGLSFSKGFGHLLGGRSGGLFFENQEDGVFMSRFQNTFLIYTQNRLGCTLPTIEPLGGFQMQLYWNNNATADLKRQYWANFVESGPGLRLRWRWMPPSLVFSADVLRGANTINEGNPRRPNYYDVRVGFWYALTH
jgi:Tfp pilus assembly protein PilF